MKRIQNKIRRLITEYIAAKKSLKEYPVYLEPGFYFYWARRISKKSFGVPVCFISRAASEQALSEVGCKISPSKTVVVFSGGWSGKTVFLYDDYVVSFYDRRGIEWLNNINKYSDRLPYPISAYLWIDCEKNFAIAQRVKGRELNDQTHIVTLANAMLESLSESEFVRNAAYGEFDIQLKENDLADICSCVQHGDASKHNVLWLSDTEFRFIDLDGIMLYPLCYDFFRLVLTEFGEAGLKWFLDGAFDEKLEKLFAAAGEAMPLEKLKDKYLAVFYIMTNGCWQDSWSRSPLIPESYRLTRSAVAAVENHKREQLKSNVLTY